MSVKLNSSSGGSVTLQEPTTASDFTLTLPAQTATVITDSSAILNIGSGQIYKDASGNVGVGGVPSGRFDVLSSTSPSAAFHLFFGANGDNYYTCGNSGVHVFRTGSNGERARIDSSGNLLVGKTASGIATVGVQCQASGLLICTRDSDVPFVVNRNTNDGTLVSLRQENTEEGTISVSGTTVSYNGGHLARWSQLPTDQRDPALLKGTVLSNLDEMCVWLDAEGNPLPNEQLNKMKISDVEGDVNVAGVFVNWDNDDQTYTYDMNVAMTGDMIIRIAQGVVVQKGDLLMSAGDGTAKPQGDDIIRSKTVAKVTSNHVTCTYEDGSYCVPCVLMAC